ncbi:MAG: hypothetical protein AAF297_08350 [Planctomycetota bacterium]
MIRTATVLVAGVAMSASASVITIDFSNDALGNALANGQAVSGNDVSSLFSLSSSGNNAGLAIFDSTASGPNASAEDQDLLVNLGNVLILQDNAESAKSGGIFSSPDDDGNGGTMSFSFAAPTELASITLIDMDGGNGGTVTLVDSDGDVRAFDIPNGWTNDVAADGPSGFGTIDFANLGAQSADSPGTDVTIAQNDAGFDLADVVSMDIFLIGSGGVDNLTIVPAPGALFVAGTGLAMIARRRRG